MMIKKICFLLFFPFCFNCQNGFIQKTDFAPFELSHLKCPVVQGGEPNLFISKNGKAFLSWVEYLSDSTDALFFSQLKNDEWTPPKEIARGNDWFVNWADFPSLVVYENNENHMAAHWLQKRTAGTYDYDIHISQSKDGGKTWDESFILHTDEIASEHGFVTMLPRGDKIFATWLDGRFTKVEEEPSSHDDHGHGGGAMTLRTAMFDIEGNLSEEVELDRRTCDCCQTTAAMTSQGAIVAYRDRLEEEIRDISFVKKMKDGWSSPKPVYNDNWKIAGCPVNGPSIKANGNDVVVAWFTAAKEHPKVLVAFSSDSGNNFSNPIRIDDGNPLGRVGIVLLGKTTLVSWLEEVGEGAEIRVAKITSAGKLGESITVSKSSTSRRSGFPQMEKVGKKIIFAWTEAGEKNSTVKTAFWKFRN